MISDGMYGISGFYRNDQPNGLALEIKGSPDALGNIRDAILAYDEPNDPVTEAELFAQLDEFAARPNPLSNDEAIVALMVINLLENRGKIVPDEWNGMLFSWIENDRLVFSDGAM